MKRSYKQNCALANALDLVGERWTLLIVRELLIGPRRYGELLENLQGMGTNLLASRLKEMSAADLIKKEEGSYRLTDTGNDLEAVVHALIRFALRLNVAPEPGFLHRTDWDAVALAALYDNTRNSGLDGLYVLLLDGAPFTVEVDGDQCAITPGTCERPRTTVEIERRTARKLAAGDVTLSEAFNAGEVQVTGQKSAAKKLLRALHIAD
ncbi:MAG: winged helix-turn-helix transcriptional regulator [Woeseiaceae bacterium]